MTSGKDNQSKKSGIRRDKNVNAHRCSAEDSIETSSDPSFPIVGIGASAGGLEALELFFSAMRADSGMAFVLVSHLDPTHVSLLPELLQRHARFPVCQIKDGTKVEPEHLYIIPPNKDLRILNGVLQLLDFTRPRGVNMPIDSFFRSLAQDQGANAIGIILSGTGTDGTLGLKAIKGELGMVMVQEEESATYDGMPRSAIATGLADYILPPGKMPDQLLKYTQHATHALIPGIELERAPDMLQKIFIILRTQTGHDFSYYKKNTIYRRIIRRMNLHQIDDIEDYVHFLQENEREVRSLFKELLIGVTNFFRDPEAFVALEKILLELVSKKPDGYTFRAWVPGCSTGEEAYSIAITLKECITKLQRNLNVQIFGTDIDEDAIEQARSGLYPQSIAADVGIEKIKRYFTVNQDGTYKIQKAIREMLVFATHNVIKDPPFTKLDLLCCRNLLIYFGSELQKKLRPLFHYGLKQGGILFLGSSETIGQNTNHFYPIDNKWKIYRRNPEEPSSRPALDVSYKPATHLNDDAVSIQVIREAEEMSTMQLIEAILQESESPPCVIIDSANNVIYIHGRIGNYLEPAEGRASNNILKMVRPGLKTELSSAIRKVGLHKQEICLKDLRVQQNGGFLSADITVKPIEQGGVKGLLMIVFQESVSAEQVKKIGRKQSATKTKHKSVEELEEELRYTKDTLQTTIEELETSNEELKSTNEELQSTNEELQSANEELETSKEELQSLNEESNTVNAELQSRVDALSQSNDDMKNLLDSTNIATIFLDTEICVRRFTQKATEIIPLVEMDSGRPLKHFATMLADVDLAEYAEQVLKDLVIREDVVTSKDGHYYMLRVHPYRTVNNVIDGVVMTFDDITSRKETELDLKNSEARLSLAFQATNDAVWDYDVIGDSLSWNAGYNKLFGEITAKLKDAWQWRMDHIHPDDRDRIVASIQAALNGDSHAWRHD
jgi:two-component system CheB/CheR fusion protein